MTRPTTAILLLALAASRPVPAHAKRVDAAVRPDAGFRGILQWLGLKNKVVVLRGRMKSGAPLVLRKSYAFRGGNPILKRTEAVIRRADHVEKRVWSYVPQEERISSAKFVQLGWKFVGASRAAMQRRTAASLVSPILKGMQLGRHVEQYAVTLHYPGMEPVEVLSRMGFSDGAVSFDWRQRQSQTLPGKLAAFEQVLRALERR